MNHTPHSAHPPDPDDPTDSLPPSVWATAQSSPVAQRRDRYTPESTAHPARMLPAIAAHAIERYSEPGDVVLDPMAGIGTTLVEAMHQDRHAVGVEYEPQWAALAQANIDHAASQGATGTGTVIAADARHLADALPTKLRGNVELVLTSPPYGANTHGQVTTTPGAGVHKHDWAYSSRRRDRNNLAHLNHDQLLTDFTAILTSCAEYLRPGGHIAITTRPYRRHGTLIDFPNHVLRCATDAGLTPVDRCVALLARVTAEDELVPRGSFFQLDAVKKHRARSLPVHLVVHEDVLVVGMAA